MFGLHDDDRWAHNWGNTKKNPGKRLWWFEAHWPSFVVVLLQLLHVLLGGLGDGWRQLGLEFIEEGESLTRRTDIVYIVFSTNFLQSVSWLIWTTHAAVSPELLWSCPSSVLVSWALRTSSVPPDIQPRPRWTAFSPLQRRERRRYWSQITPKVSKYLFSSSDNIFTESGIFHNLVMLLDLQFSNILYQQYVHHQNPPVQNNTTVFIKINKQLNTENIK